MDIADEDNHYFKINGISSTVFLGLKESKSLPEIKSKIMSEYLVESEQLDKDVNNLLDFLLKNKLFTKADDLKLPAH